MHPRRMGTLARDGHPRRRRRKLGAEKVSDVAEEVSPQSAARNRDAELWARIDGRGTTRGDRLMEAGPPMRFGEK